MYKKITLPVIFLLMTTALLSQNVVLFENCEYSGKKAYLAAGSYKLSQMKISNDQLSSMQIPGGMKVTIYEHDDFGGRSATYTGNISCLTDGWNDNASSLVVESQYGSYQPYNQSDYVTFFTDCYSRGTSQSLRPGNYSGSQLGALRLNISSFTIYGNLRIRVYLNNDNLSGYSSTFEASETCLGNTYNDKIGSLVIEYKTGTGYNPNTGGYNPNTGGSGSYATIYTDCNYNGSSLRLAPGYYQGDKLGLLRFDISSIEIPTNLRAKVFINNEYLSGTSYIVSENTRCLSNTLNNRIGSLVIEEVSGYNGNNNNNNYNPYQPGDERVILYTDSDFKGTSASVLPGSYSTMALAGFIDNSLSSLYLPAGYKVVLYEFENFGGKSYTVNQTKSGFIISNWNDKASSIKIYRN